MSPTKAPTQDWSNETSIAFVEDYRSLECLWRPTDPYYKDRNSRVAAQQYLTDKYELGSRKIVNNKIKSLRSYFHRLRAEAARKRSEDGRDLEPTWFLYKDLMFILDDDECQSANDTFTAAWPDAKQEPSEEDQFSATQDDDDSIISEQNCTQLESPPPTIVDREESSAKIEDREESSRSRNQTIKIKEIAEKITTQFDQCKNATVSPLRSVPQTIPKRDHLSAFAEYVEAKIRNLKEPRLQAVAEMRINSLLFEVEMEKIGEDMSTSSCPISYTTRYQYHPTRFNTTQTQTGTDHL